MTGDNLALTSDGLKYTPVAEGEDADGDQVMTAQSDDRKRLRYSQCFVLATISTLRSNSMQIIALSRIDYYCRGSRKYKRFAVGGKTSPNLICYNVKAIGLIGNWKY